jgi:hypothetical protein
MRPDLLNISIIGEGDGKSGTKVLTQHRAFSELRGEGPSPAEGLLALLGLLKRASGWVEDSWHSLELERAVFDVESMLELLVSSKEIKIHGFNCTIRKTHDLIYASNYDTRQNRAGSVHGGPRGLEEAEEQDTTVVIYSVGRRCGDRRWSKPGQGPRAGCPERRDSERRSVDRRQFNRIKLIDEIPSD